jgi:DedD protein
MEKKKLLYTAISVGVFLVIVIGAAILIMSPSGSASVRERTSAGKVLASGGASKGAPNTASIVVSGETSDEASSVASSEASGAVPASSAASDASPVIMPGVTAAADSQTPAASGTESSVSSVSVASAPAVADPETMVRNAPSGLQNAGTEQGAKSITVNVGTHTATPAPARANSARKPGKESEKAEFVMSEAQPAAKREGAAKIASAAPASSKQLETGAKGPAAKAGNTAKGANNYTAYWIQTGSFANKAWAEEAQKKLDAKGITSVIENREVNGAVWYRVRMGPYTSKDEAEFWQKLVVTIDGFQNSQVWENKVTAS